MMFAADFGSVFTALSSIDHRRVSVVVVLENLAGVRKQNSQVANWRFNDMRNLGSAGGIYADPSIPITQRATRTACRCTRSDPLSAFEQAVGHDGPVQLGAAGDALDELFGAHSAVK